MRNRQVKLVADHDETLDLSDPHQAEIHRREMTVARNVMNVLQRVYPGHPWAVRVDGKGLAKAVLIKLPAVMRPRDHYIIPMPGKPDILNRLITRDYYSIATPNLLEYDCLTGASWTC